MFQTLVILLLLAIFFVVGRFSRSRGRRKRPVFQENGIFPGRLSEGLLHALISDRGYLRADTRIADVSGFAVVVDRDGACGRLLLYPALAFGRDQDLPGLKSLAERQARGRATTMVIVGGNEEFGRSAFAATAPLRALHIDDAGRIHEVRASLRSSAPRLVIESALDRMARDLRDGAFPSIDLETARSLAQTDGGAQAIPQRAFRGVVTTALTMAIVLCFAVEVAISRDSWQGGGATLSVVYRMGGIHRPAVASGEWQRLIAGPFLHFGALHLAMNGWAQWSLGVPIEFLVGPWRFLLLWVVSALGASLTSLAFNATSVSAGASGAIFGLLGAFTTFVFLRKDVLPQPVPRSLRNGVLTTLLLNLLISFIPSIDMAAHAGGFVAGAVLGLGLVRRDRDTRPAPPRASLLRTTVFAVVLLGVGLTSFEERADLTVRAPGIEKEYSLAEIRLPIPRDFEVSETRRGGLSTIEADQDPASPFSVTFRVSDPQKDEASARRLLQSLRSEAQPVKDSDWLAFSQLGVQNLRAIEIVVVGPASCRSEAERLSSELAARIH